MKYTKEFFALYDINFEVKKGETVCLVGDSGSGKSCVLRVLCGLEKPTKGEVYIKNIPIKKVDFINDISLGYIPYKGAFFEKKTVYENLKYVVKLRTKHKAEEENLINKIVMDFKLEAILNTKVSELGLYQRYMVSMARLGSRELDILVIDDIFKDLNKEEKEAFIALIQERFIKIGKTVVVAACDETVPKAFNGRIIKLSHGSIE